MDPNILMALNSISRKEAYPIEQTLKQLNHFLHYMARQPDTTIRYHRSDMVLNVHYDTSSLSEQGAQIQAAGHLFLVDTPTRDKHNLLNGVVHTLCTVLKHVAASEAEAELGALFSNARIVLTIRLALKERGHEQPPTQIHTDNTNAAGIENKPVKQQ